MDCFYTVSAFRDWHSLSSTGHFYRPLTLCLNQKRFVSRFIIFFLLLLRLRVQQSFHKTLWEENHSSETTNKRLKWDKRLWRFFWQMGRVRAIIPSESRALGAGQLVSLKPRSSVRYCRLRTCYSVTAPVSATFQPPTNSLRCLP